MPARILLVGDVHLGRRPTRLPGVLAESGLHASELTPVAAWKTVVETALESSIDAVVLAGDVVEDEDDFYEVHEPLRGGVQRLVDAGITVRAVAGNHDVKVLPRLADAIDGFQLLGRDGTWEREVLRIAGVPAVALLGWSFPERSVRWNPLDDTLPPATDGLVTLGVLHCDVGVSDSPHAPVPMRSLVDAYPEAWFLGHIHAPGDLSGPRPLGYLGTLVGLDPTETGRHGPWLVEVDGKGRVTAEQLPLAPLRWEALDVDVTELEDARELGVVLARALAELHERLADERDALRAVGVRPRLVGATAHSLELVREAARDELRTFSAVHDGVVYFVDKVRDATTPARDLDALAAGTTPPALMARRLLALGRGLGDAECARLVGEAREPLERVAHAATWSPIASGAGGASGSSGTSGAEAEGDSLLGDERIAELLTEAARAALEELLAQEEAR